MRFTFETRLVGEEGWTQTITSDLPAHLLVEWIDGWFGIAGDRALAIRNFRLIRDED